MRRQVWVVEWFYRNRWTPILSAYVTRALAQSNMQAKKLAYPKHQYRLTKYEAVR